MHGSFVFVVHGQKPHNELIGFPHTEADQDEHKPAKRHARLLKTGCGGPGWRHVDIHRMVITFGHKLPQRKNKGVPLHSGLGIRDILGPWASLASIPLHVYLNTMHKTRRKSKYLLALDAFMPRMNASPKDLSRESS